MSWSDPVKYNLNQDLHHNHYKPTPPTLSTQATKYEPLQDYFYTTELGQLAGHWLASQKGSDYISAIPAGSWLGR